MANSIRKEIKEFIYDRIYKIHKEILPRDREYRMNLFTAGDWWMGFCLGTGLTGRGRNRGNFCLNWDLGTNSRDRIFKNKGVIRQFFLGGPERSIDLDALIPAF